jgi:hypothetical protein
LPNATVNLKFSPNSKRMTDYSASSIRVLKDLEPVKERPGMYTRTTCPTHIVQEVIDNAADEALAGYTKKIAVLVRADGVIEVSDNGRGIPVEMHPEEGRPALNWSSASCTPAASSTRRTPATPTVFPAVCTASAFR